MITCNSRSLAFAMPIACAARWTRLRRRGPGCWGIVGRSGRGGWAARPLAAEPRRVRWRCPPAGQVGGGSPGSNNPAGNGSARTGSPGLMPSWPARSEITRVRRVFQTPSTISDIGGYGGAGVAPAADPPGVTSPRP